MCDERLLKISTEKTKVMVFRKGGHLSKKEVWYLGGQKLDVVNNWGVLTGMKYPSFFAVTPL